MGPHTISNKNNEKLKIIREERKKMHLKIELLNSDTTTKEIKNSWEGKGGKCYSMLNIKLNLC
jgi:hypothetical protein